MTTMTRRRLHATTLHRPSNRRLGRRIIHTTILSILVCSLLSPPVLAISECKLIEQCQACTNTDKQLIPECKQTAKVEAYQCSGDSGAGLPDDFVMYKSCKYTQADEEFRLIRLQVFCLFIGSMSLLSVRKQKRQNASLFDQRKMSIKVTSEIEMGNGSTLSRTISNDEVQPLTEAVSLEVI